jgi:hypothetical protein
MSGGDDRMRVDRRTTIKWLAATMAALQTGCSPREKNVGPEIPPAPDVRAGRVEATGYGTDPDRMHPTVPWPKTMTDAQLDTAAALCDMIIPEDERSPAASSLGVHDFIDEWISAPYPQQAADRLLVLDGLAWLEEQSRKAFASGFAVASNEQKTELLDRIANVADGRPAVGRTKFFDRFRYLAVGAFYTTDAGIADIGYIGNTPLSGDYPGPSAAAMAHLNGVLEQLGLSQPATG